MGIEDKPIDVTGRFDTVTGQRRFILALYHKEKNSDFLFLLPFALISDFTDRDLNLKFSYDMITHDKRQL